MKERKRFYTKFIMSIFISVLLINFIVPISYFQVNAAVRLEGYDDKSKSGKNLYDGELVQVQGGSNPGVYSIYIDNQGKAWGVKYKLSSQTGNDRKDEPVIKKYYEPEDKEEAKAHNCPYDLKNTSQKNKMTITHTLAGTQTKEQADRGFTGYVDGVETNSKSSTTTTSSNSNKKTTESTESQDAPSVTLDDINDAATGFIYSGRTEAEEKISTKSLQNLSSTIYNVLLILGIVIAVIVGLILGIKFILGSIEQQAEVKKALVPYIVGCVIVFGAFTIWKVTVNILQTTTSTSSEYTKTEDGKIYCNACGHELSKAEQRAGKCSDCGRYTSGL